MAQDRGLAASPGVGYIIYVGRGRVFLLLRKWFLVETVAGAEQLRSRDRHCERSEAIQRSRRLLVSVRRERATQTVGDRKGAMRHGCRRHSTAYQTSNPHDLWIASLRSQ
jgi:hypothetical protein